MAGWNAGSRALVLVAVALSCMPVCGNGAPSAASRSTYRLHGTEEETRPATDGSAYRRISTEADAAFVVSPSGPNGSRLTYTRFRSTRREEGALRWQRDALPPPAEVTADPRSGAGSLSAVPAGVRALVAAMQRARAAFTAGLAVGTLRVPVGEGDERTEIPLAVSFSRTGSGALRVDGSGRLETRRPIASAGAEGRCVTALSLTAEFRAGVLERCDMWRRTSAGIQDVLLRRSETRVTLERTGEER